MRGTRIASSCGRLISACADVLGTFCPGVVDMSVTRPKKCGNLVLIEVETKEWKLPLMLNKCSSSWRTRPLGETGSRAVLIAKCGSVSLSQEADTEWKATGNDQLRPVLLRPGLLRPGLFSRTDGVCAFASFFCFFLFSSFFFSFSSSSSFSFSSSSSPFSSFSSCSSSSFYSSFIFFCFCTVNP